MPLEQLYSLGRRQEYHTLVATIPGQMVIAVCLAAVFVSFAFVVKLTQPIEYRR